MLQKTKIISELRAYALITFGLVIYAFGVTGFLIPHQIVGGGVTGISTIIYFLSNKVIPVGVSYFIINAALVGIAIKILGPKFGIKTIYAVIINSALLSIFQAHISEPLLADRFMSTVIAGILCGAGVGISLINGGSTAGTDIVAMIINKYRNIPPGKVILYLDVIIIGSSYMLTWQLSEILFGYVQMGVLSYTIDMVFTGQMQSVQFFIFSDKYDLVADSITRDLHRGVTVLDCQGWYTGAARKMLVIVARKGEMQGIMRITKQVDPDAFLTMNTVMGVYGKGFDTLRP
ncbi:MAG: YitT family protein [Odoribacteraceae bacterium]|jgi:uncharacterized membrane-anchored protein YitT (DUF2179 family)|nr:YitT family protein [Odoribacteraceae bacterium]